MQSRDTLILSSPPANKPQALYIFGLTTSLLFCILIVGLIKGNK